MSHTRMTVAALYVDPRGVYANVPDVELWDEARDARLYPGPHPVVAHPPCQLWTNLTGVNYKRYGGAHNRPGNDDGCFFHALMAVWRWGGVLEHPAGSYAWSTFGLPEPPREYPKRWSHPYGTPLGTAMQVCEVWQSAYGHPARKRTWLIYVGNGDAPDLDWSRPPGTHQIGWYDRNKPTLGKRDASATPPAFRDVLVEMARSARPALTSL